MKRTLKCAVAAIGAAAIAVGTAVPASAANCGKYSVIFGTSDSKSCGNLGSTDINSLFKNYSSCLDILKNYGITIPNGGSCSGNQNSNTQKPNNNNCTDGSCVQKPDNNICIGGNCNQKPDDSDCPNGNCVQTPSKPNDNDCPNGNCVQTPSKPDNSDCPDGNCTQTPSKPNTSVDSSVSDYEKEVVELINEIRKEYGLSELKINTELCAVARAKSQDMKDNNYFSHTSPTYGSPFDMMKTFGISYRTAGENIAMGYRTPEAVVNAWMNSEGHRANILNASYKEIGMGHVSSGNYWTQMFIG